MDNLNAIVAEVNGGLDATNIPDLGVLGAYRTILDFKASQGSMSGGAGTFLPISGSMGISGTAGTSPPLIYLAAADFTVAGRTTKLRVRAQILTDNAAPGITYTFGLYPLTAVSAASPTASAGAVVAGSTAAIASPPASSLREASSGDFNLPADGYYALGIATGGASSEVSVTAQLQLRHV
jgi:hypothetical protein